MGIIAPPVSAAAIARVTPRLQVVANRGLVSSGTTGAGANNYTRFESQLEFTIGGQDVSHLTLAYANYFKNTSAVAETDGANPVQIEAAINFDYAGGKFNEKLFTNGVLKPTMEAAAPLLLVGPLGLDLQAGQRALIRSAALVSAGQTVCGAHNVRGSNDSGWESTATSSQTYLNNNFVSNPGAPSSASAVYRIFGPLAVLGIPKKPLPAVLIWGDSIMFGQGDTATSIQGLGWVERGLTNVNGFYVPWCNISRAGDILTNAQQHWTSQRMMLRYVTHVICGLGNNDISNGNTLAAMQGYAKDQWASAKRAGCTVYHSKLTPRTTSTDSWATAANQTIVSGYGNTAGERRYDFNAWLDTQVGQGLLDGVIDPNSAIESSPGSGKWAAGMTLDGIHPTTAGHTAMATIINALAKTF